MMALARMKTPTKVGLVAAGYAFAIALASAVVAIRYQYEPVAERDGGMYAFGDSLFWLATFCIASVPATGAALFWVRSSRNFWRVLSTAAVTVGVTGVAAFILCLIGRSAVRGSMIDVWSSLAILRILAAPLFGVLNVVAGVFAPDRSFRIAMLVATLMEAVAFSWFGFMWLTAPR